MYQAQNQITTRVTNLLGIPGQGHIATVPAMTKCTRWMLDWRAEQDHVSLVAKAAERRIHPDQRRDRRTNRGHTVVAISAVVDMSCAVAQRGTPRNNSGGKVRCLCLQSKAATS
jgi:hypothetical protein